MVNVALEREIRDPLLRIDQGEMSVRRECIERPLFLGHVLLTPKDHYETLPDLPSHLVQPLFTNAQLLALAVKQGLGADGTFIAINNIVSQSVPHLHVHIVPRRRKDGLRGFFWPRHKYDSDDEMAATAQQIRAALRDELNP